VRVVWDDGPRDLSALTADRRSARPTRTRSRPYRRQDYHALKAEAEVQVAALTAIDGRTVEAAHITRTRLGITAPTLWRKQTGEIEFEASDLVAIREDLKCRHVPTPGRGAVEQSRHCLGPCRPPRISLNECKDTRRAPGFGLKLGRSGNFRA